MRWSIRSWFWQLTPKRGAIEVVNQRAGTSRRLCDGRHFATPLEFHHGGARWKGPIT
jgi:hypothetical protein